MENRFLPAVLIALLLILQGQIWLGKGGVPTVIELEKKIKEQNSISLNMEKRKKELDEQKKKPDESQAVMDALGGTEETAADKDKKEKAADKHAKDAYLKETQQILSDWISSGAHKIAKVK